MASHGYERATVQLVASAADLAPGLVHYHFANKQEILLELVDTLVAGLRVRKEARLASAGDMPRARLDAYLDALLALGPDADPEAAACWALVGAAAVRQPEVRSAYEGWLVQLRAEVTVLLRDACRDEGRSTRGTTAMAAALVALVEGYFRVAVGAPSVVPDGSAARMARRLAAGLLDSQPPKKGRKR